MTTLHILTVAAGVSIDILGLVWLVSAAWFAAVRPGPLTGKLRHFARTLLPEPWMIAVLIVLSVVVHLLPRSIWTPLIWKTTIFTGIGSVLIVASVALMIWARFALGDMWAGRPMVQEDHQLRTGGPYQVVRHPIYTGLLGIMIGATLLSGFGSSLLMLVFVIGWLLRRVHVEDHLMIDTFGDDYRTYRRRVPALVPFTRQLTRV